MRGLALFVAGIVVGLGITAGAQNSSPNQGIIGLNHVGINVPDVGKALEYYTKTMGFPEAFRVKSAAGEELVFVQINKNTFMELMPANAQRPPGISHFALQVDNMPAATEMFKARGASVGQIITTPMKTILSFITDPSGNSIELIEFQPGAPAKEAMDRWR
jgi:catechol 2,3-dioxygenase-like lactoylglutathione lyase family enzyme